MSGPGEEFIVQQLRGCDRVRQDHRGTHRIEPALKGEERFLLHAPSPTLGELLEAAV